MAFDSTPCLRTIAHTCTSLIPQFINQCETSLRRVQQIVGNFFLEIGSNWIVALDFEQHDVSNRRVRRQQSGIGVLLKQLCYNLDIFEPRF